jgi:hypothetical protein
VIYCTKANRVGFVREHVKIPRKKVQNSLNFPSKKIFHEAFHDD